MNPVREGKKELLSSQEKSVCPLQEGLLDEPDILNCELTARIEYRNIQENTRSKVGVSLMVNEEQWKYMF